MSEHGIHGYFGDDSGYKTALRSWMSKKHNEKLPKHSATKLASINGFIAL